MMKNVIRPKLTGRFRLTVIRPDGMKRVAADFPNLILDAGLNRIGTGGFLTYAQVGSGSTAPTVTDTALEEYLGHTSTQQEFTAGNSGSAPYYGWFRKEWRFAAGVAAGNISEVGIGWGTNNNLFSRALVVDAEGDPTTITVLSDEVLDVAYEMRMYVPTEDTEFDVTIGGVEYAVVGRAAQASSVAWSPQNLGQYGTGSNFSPGMTPYSGSINAITGQPSGTNASIGNATTLDAYSNNSKQRKANWVVPLSNGNVEGGGIKSVMLDAPYMLGYYQFEFDAKIPKDATKVMTLSATFSWDRGTIPA